jgi:hypothetical protein
VSTDGLGHITYGVFCNPCAPPHCTMPGLPADGELRQPGPEVMRKLSGAKDKLGLRVHGLIIGSPGG